MSRLNKRRFPGHLAQICALSALLLLAACTAGTGDTAPESAAASPARLPVVPVASPARALPRQASEFVFSALDLQASAGASFDGEYLQLGDPAELSYAVFAVSVPEGVDPPTQLQLSGEAAGVWLALAQYPPAAWNWQSSAISFAVTQSISLPAEGLLNSQRELRFALVCPPGASARIRLDINMTLPEPATWNLLLWMAADNNLGWYGYADLEELESVGSTGKVRILAGYDVPAGITSEPVSGFEQVRFIKVVQDSDDTRIVIDADPANVAFERAGYDCGDPRHLREFVQWASDNFPAERTAIVLWGHGTGWRPERDAPPPEDKGGSGVLIDWTDGSGGGHTSNAWIASELADFHFDLMLFDSCNMGDIESLYDYREVADYFVASSEVVPIWGFPYDAVLQGWNSAPQALSAPQVGTIFIDRFIEHYDDRKICHALVDGSKLEPLAVQIGALGAGLALLPPAEAELLASVIGEQQNFVTHCDLGGFLLDYQAQATHDGVKTQLAACAGAYDEAIVYFASENADWTSGLSMFLPHAGYLNGSAAFYRPLSFNADSQWLESLEALGFE